MLFIIRNGFGLMIAENLLGRGVYLLPFFLRENCVII